MNAEARDGTDRNVLAQASMCTSQQFGGTASVASAPKLKRAAASRPWANSHVLI